jgi:tRNA threonylcarbamoyladenosine biosynthesis protein TsaB
MRLSVDTSTLTLSLALIDDADQVLEHVVVGPPKRQSEILPGVVEDLLKRQGVALDGLAGFVVGLGPGSFTGLRIGLSMVKALAWALEKPVAGVSSLAAVALEGPPGSELWACAEVKKGELYLGRYRREGHSVTPLSLETSVTVAQLAQQVRAAPSALVLGPAVAAYREQLEALGVDAKQLSDTPRFPSAVALAQLATLPRGFDKEAVFALEPKYLRGSGAEENPKFPPLPGVEPTARLKED